MFSLNPEVTWQEVGMETKLRLKTLPVEAVRNRLKPGAGTQLVHMPRKGLHDPVTVVNCSS